jgi:hypothetical protein
LGSHGVTQGSFISMSYAALSITSAQALPQSRSVAPIRARNLAILMGRI